jgi:hypothetical protein
MSKPGFTTHSEPRHTALPGSPIDGQIINFLADAANDIVWRLQYRLGSSSAYKWLFIGGAHMVSQVETSESTTGGYLDLATVGPSITLPLAGDYDIEHGASIYLSAANNGGSMSPQVGSDTTQLDVDRAYLISGTAGPGSSGYGGPVARSKRKTGLTAGAIIRAKYQNPGGAGATFAARWLRVRPVRVG